MKSMFILIVQVLFFSVASAAPIEEMQLKGQGGVKFLGFVKLYDAYFYTENINSNTDALSPEVSKCLKLQYDVSLKKEDFIEGANTILSNQHPREKIDSFTSELDQLNDAYQDVGEGDFYTLCYDAQSSTTSLSLNNTDLITIQSKGFSSLYFGIWLGSKEPIDEGLRKKLLNIKD